MTLTIRRAQKGDAALILEFIIRLAEFERLNDEVTATEADIDRDLFGPEARVFCEIAEQEGEPVGFALWYYTYSTFQGRHGIWLEDLFVDPDARGNGIGKALLVNLAKRCKAEGLGRLSWWVLNWNETAIDFYKAQGAVLHDEWTTCRVSGPELEKLASQ
ncbi:GNAT family N-acetyltransferase [Pelagibacterium lentulum]|uniref:N-acetyltransferase n=1 Tax=Pelagibacterium lentulum TaxID=2029865 RepID=A0A916R9Z2_9HYPH|nr:GNAT family N-acetyltransferase [Pelagibacterium lentulum]GGA46934.1 N-acetyltransferase [Pelagibacterium lentulum]